MDATLLAVMALIAVALIFDYINGFHDAANSIATVVSTRVLTPGQAVVWAATFNFLAAFGFGTAVAKTVGAGHDRPDDRHVGRDLQRPDGRDRLGSDHVVRRPAHQLVACAGRWLCRRRRLPRPASVGARSSSGWTKTLIFIVLAPLMGMALGLLLSIDHAVDVPRTSRRSASTNGSGGCSSCRRRCYSLGHGTNDAQKTMGIIAGVLFTAGYLDDVHDSVLGDPVARMRHRASARCPAAGASSTRWAARSRSCSRSAGSPPRPAGAITLFIASSLGIPVSTTHTITGAIVGVGSVQTPVCGPLGRREADRLGLGTDHPGLGGDRRR